LVLNNVSKRNPVKYSRTEVRITADINRIGIECETGFKRKITSRAPNP
jgi:hypothetical protein